MISENQGNAGSVIQIEGQLQLKDEKIAIIIARFNDFFTSRLLAGAMDALVRHGAKQKNITQIWVPGSFELPLVAGKLCRSKSYQPDGIICLGCLVRGATPHFDFIAAETTKGIANVALENALPVSYGVLTVDNLEQAIERSGTKAGNKGADADMSLIEMIDLYRKIS